MNSRLLMSLWNYWKAGTGRYRTMAAIAAPTEPIVSYIPAHSPPATAQTDPKARDMQLMML
jgi:hypothetical protein